MTRQHVCFRGVYDLVNFYGRKALPVALKSGISKGLYDDRNVYRWFGTCDKFINIVFRSFRVKRKYLVTRQTATEERVNMVLRVHAFSFFCQRVGGSKRGDGISEN